MAGWDIALIALALLAYAVVSRRLAHLPLTAAMLFLVAGFVLGDDGFGWFAAEIDSSAVRALAEITLAAVLFADASAIDTRALRREAGIPLRLLLIGLPLTIALGTVAALGLFPGLDLFSAAVLAVLLAPTDAALGQAVVSDRRIPSRIRQGLNVESGLNDGICVPLLFTAAAMATLEETPSIDGGILVDLVEEVGIGVAVGVAIAALVATLLVASTARGWLAEEWAQVVPPAAAALAYAVTDELGGSGFIGAFVAGLLYGRLLGSRAHETVLLLEEVGQVLSAVTFFVFAAVVVGPALTETDVATITYAVLSLTAVRMAPVTISMLGSRAAPATIAFTGWFGPRGLASIVFALTIVEESGLVDAPLIVRVASITVVVSVFAHGATAAWLSDRYVTWFRRSEHRLDIEAERVTTGIRPRGMAARTATSSGGRGQPSPDRPSPSDRPPSAPQHPSAHGPPSGDHGRAGG
ncbi:MAG: cation:proton antiporter [Actinomycetota bacterium]|nr:cation:proton antiporter [Actinomycetota bacterium]